MKNPRMKTSRGIPLALSNICNTCSITDIEDAVADSQSGAELVSKLNRLGIFNKFALDRETDSMVRLKCVDYCGNVDYLEAIKETPKEQQLATHITNEINCIFDYKAFVEQMSREHRTLQADFTTLCLEWLLKCREMYESDNFDGRNMYACKTGKVLMDYLEKGRF